MRKRSFAQALSLLAVFWLVAEIILGVTRDPIADRYRGDVFVVSKGENIKVNDVQVKVDLVNQGKIVGNRPYINSDGMRIEFTGSGVDQLVRLGLPTDYVSKEGDRFFYKGYCEFAHVRTRKGEYLFSLPPKEFISTSYTRAYEFSFLKNDNHACRPAKFGMLDFSHAEVLLPLGRFSLLGSLERDSHISPLQRIIMWLKYDRKSLGDKNSFSGALDF